MPENILEEHRVEAQQAARLAVGADFVGELGRVVDFAPRAWVRGSHVRAVLDVYMGRRACGARQADVFI